jgi:EAL domain-containing protein (putative c-di-GMP-specific phosphodiesterase class I)/ActR/RegA family two-component response regulator
VRPPRLLVVDDDDLLAGFIAQVGRRAGYEVRTAASVEEIWGDGSFEPDLVFVDLNMEASDGLAVLRELAARGSRARVRILSGADIGLLRSATRLGEELGLAVGEPLAKPVGLAELQRVLESERGDVERSARPSPARATHGGITAEELAAGIAGGELAVEFQPIVDLAALEPVGAEALVRWNHPVRGLVPPLAFVAVAETAGLGARMTEAILEQALTLLAREELLARAVPLSISLNMGAAALAERGFADGLAQRLKRHGVATSRLVIEVTESVVEANRIDVLEALNRLRLRGCELSVDDFGTGTSSLERVEQLPCSELKIERAFVGQVEKREQSAAIVHGILELARRLGLRTVGEGIETPGILAWLREAGCDRGQGYLFSRALPPDAFVAWLAEWPERRARLAAPRSD